MDPITLISGALTIAKATGLDEWLGGMIAGEPGEKAASQIVNIAAHAAGGGTVGEIVAKIEQSDQFKHDIRTALLDNQHAIQMAVFEDRKSARQMYQATDHKTADDLAQKVFNWNPFMIVALVLAQIGVLVYVTDPAVASAASAVIGGSISYLWQERQTVIGFFFGSSHGSKVKTDKMGI